MTLHPFQDHWLLGLMSFIISSSVVVALGHLSFWTALLSFVVAAIVTLVRARTTPKELTTEEEVANQILSKRWRLIGVGTYILLQSITSFTLLRSQTGLAISSPWQVLPTTIFLCFGTSFFLLLLLSDHLSLWTKRLLWSWHYFISFSVSALIYRYGFGFDPFIHQAATRYLAEHGSIQLPSFLYLGQYAFEAGLHKLTLIPITIIDRWLVPVFATTLATIILPKLSYAWNQPKKILFALPLLLLPFLSLTFTVPYQLAYLCLIFAVYALPILSTRSGIWLAIGLVAVSGLFHPLLAIPVAGLIIGSWLSKRSTTLGGAGAFITVILGLSGAFALYIHQHGGTIITPTIQALLRSFKIMIGFPYDASTWTWYAKAFYGLVHITPLIFITVGWIGYTHLETGLRRFRTVYAGTALAILLVAIGIATSITFADIISTEQFEFALRLRYAIPLLFMPGVAIALHRWIQIRSEAVRPVILLALAIIITATWYVSYPQWNRYIRQSSVGISETDIRTVQTIERIAQGNSYAALTPQMTSAAALHLIGFERELSPSSVQRYPYAIPTGGAFYQQYLRLWHESDVDAIISEARSLSHEQQLFIAIPKQWDPNKVIHNRLAPLSTATEELDNAVDIYQITK